VAATIIDNSIFTCAHLRAGIARLVNQAATHAAGASRAATQDGATYGSVGDGPARSEGPRMTVPQGSPEWAGVGRRVVAHGDNPWLCHFSQIQGRTR
jgi:hypothetical protein